MDDILERMIARGYDHSRRGFYRHCAVFSVIMGSLMAVHLTGLRAIPRHWAFSVWTAALLIHAYSVFVAQPARIQKFRQTMMVRNMLTEEDPANDRVAQKAPTEK